MKSASGNGGAGMATGELLQRSQLIIDRMDRLLIEIDTALGRGERLVFTDEQKRQIEAALAKARRQGLLQGCGLPGQHDPAPPVRRSRHLPPDFG